MPIPEDSLERKKWMLKLWQDYGERFAVFHPDEQPLPSPDVWHEDMYEPYDPDPDQDAKYDPRVIRHLRWWEDTRRFLRERFGLEVSLDYLFDCLAGKYQGRFSDDIDEREERRWYVRALRMGAFMFDGKVGVGFSCRSRRCQRIKCSLKLQREEERPEEVEPRGSVRVDADLLWNREDATHEGSDRGFCGARY